MFLTGALVKFPVFSQDTTPPDTPELDSVSVYDPATGSVIVSWFPCDSADVVSYIIYRSILSSWQQIAEVPAPATSYIDITATANYRPELYRISAKDESNNYSPMTPVTPVDKHHNTIYIFPYQDSINCEMAIRINWNKYKYWEEGVSEYRLYISENGGPWLLYAVTDGSASIYYHETVNDTTLYCYFVRAVSNSGRTSTSNQTCFYTNMPDPPKFINADYATVAGDSKINLCFTVDSTADIRNYRLYRASRPANSFSVISTYNGYNYGKLYYSDYVDSKQRWVYKLAAVNNCGTDILESNIASNIVISVEANEDLTQKIEWTKYSTWLGGIEYYNIYRLEGSEPPALIATITNTDTVFFDDITFYATNMPGISGEFCYYVEAVEGNFNPYSVKGGSLSGIACARQFERVFIPNSFTPNGDELNSEFRPSVVFLKEEKYELTIYNRWGERIFRTTDCMKGWDGKVNGNVVKNGAYVYVLKYLDIDDRLIEKAGTVYLYYP